MQIQIPEIVDRIKEEKCVLLLGPGLAVNDQGDSMQTCLIKYFEEKQLQVKESLDDLYTCDPITKTRALDHFQKYCRENSEPIDTHRKLALIPCHLYISITPDLLMKQALDDYGVDHEFQYYVKNQKPDDVNKPTRERPLFYSLFGSIENPKSIIFNQWDLIQYLFSIIKEFDLPPDLRAALNDANYFIFIGFDFEKWYLKMLLKLLLEESKPSIATEEGKGFNEKLKSFYHRRYGLEFVETNIEEYIKNLHDECKNQGLLREIKERVQPSIQKEIRKLIEKDEIKHALQRFEGFLEELVMKDKSRDNQDLLDEIYNHSANYNRNEKKLRLGTVTEDDANVARNKISQALLEMAQAF